MKAYIDAAATTQVYSGRARRVLIQVNEDITGTITVIDGTSGSTANVATITDPVGGTRYEYWDFSDGVRIITSAAGDVTVSVLADAQP